MAAPVNNIAATFSSTSAATSLSSFSPRTSISLSSPSPAAIAASWNPHHSTRSWTLKSSLLDLYGSPAPLPLRPISTAQLRPVIPLRRPHTRTSSTAPAAMKLPIAGISLSYLDDRNSGAAVVRTATLAGLCRGKRRAVVVGVSAAFSPGCTRFLRRVMSAEEHRSAEMVACVARNDVFVMAAWGRSVRAVDGDGDVSRGRLVMLSDGGGELFGAVSCGGLGLESGGSRRGEAERFCLSVSNGIVTSVSFDDEVDGEDDDDGGSRAGRINGRGGR